MVTVNLIGFKINMIPEIIEVAFMSVIIFWTHEDCECEFGEFCVFRGELSNDVEKGNN